jgi:hypothetical protein
MQDESAGHRRDRGISREGSVELRRALIDLGIGLWHSDQPARAYAAGEGPRETRRDHRLRVSAPRDPDRLRVDPRPGLPSRHPLGLNTQHCSASRPYPIAEDNAGDEGGRQGGAPAAQRGRTSLNASSPGAPSTRGRGRREVGDQYPLSRLRPAVPPWTVRRVGSDADSATAHHGDAVTSSAPDPPPHTAARTTPDDPGAFPQRSNQSA